MSYKRMTVLATALAVSACSMDRAVSPVPRVGEEAAARALSQFALDPKPTGVLLVEYAPGMLAATRASVAAAGGRILSHLPELKLLYAVGVDGLTASSLKAAAGVVSVASDFSTRAIPERGSDIATEPAGGQVGATGTDQRSAYFYRMGKQWNIQFTLADKAWIPSGGGKDELVCVIDGGIDPYHSDLVGTVDILDNAITVKRFPTDHSFFDYNGHGTAVAGIIRSNGSSVASTAPDARLCSIKSLSEDGSGTIGDLVLAIVKAANFGADVINVSARWYLDLNTPNDLELYRKLQAAVAWAHYKRAVIVAAHGDDGLNLELISAKPYTYVVVPSMIPGVIGVGATWDRSDKLAPWSNYGSAESMDLVAPGHAIWAPCSQYLPICSTSSDFYLVGIAGTSYAAPLVAGAAAVVESTVKARFGASIEMTPAAIAKCLRRTADKVGDRASYGSGRLNVLRAVQGCNQSG